MQRSEAARRLVIRPTMGSLPGVRAPNENDRPEEEVCRRAGAADGRIPFPRGSFSHASQQGGLARRRTEVLGRRPTVAGQRRNLTGFACSTRCVPHASRRALSLRSVDVTRGAGGVGNEQSTFGLGGGVSRSPAEGIPSFDTKPTTSLSPEGVPPMTRYLCADPSHGLGADPASIDVTAQVRLEREFLPRESAYLAETGDVLRRVRELPDDDPDLRAADVRRILTGTTAPLDVPVILVAGDRVPRAPGLYEMDELRRSERSIAMLLDRYAQPGLSREGSEDVVVLREEIGTIRPDGTLIQPGCPPTPHGGAVPAGRDRHRACPRACSPCSNSPRGWPRPVGMKPRSSRRSTTRRAQVRHRSTPPSPWRVMVECPVPTGEPPTPTLAWCSRATVPWSRWRCWAPPRPGSETGPEQRRAA